MARRKKKQSNWYIFIRVFITLTLTLVALGIYEFLSGKNSWFEENNSVLYDEFSVYMPTAYSIHGIDVSKYQRKINWELVEAMEVDHIKIGFALIKATEGTDLTDKNFERNWEAAKSAGIIRGAYHFFIPNESAQKQALYFLAHVKFEKDDLPPVVDVEQLYGVTPPKMRMRLQEFLDLLELKTHVRPIIYTSAKFYTDQLGDSFDAYPLWVAHYQQPERPGIHRDWSFWQHSEAGTVNGIKSKVDLNVFSGDSLSFKKMLIP